MSENLAEMNELSSIIYHTAIPTSIFDDMKKKFGEDREYPFEDEEGLLKLYNDHIPHLRARINRTGLKDTLIKNLDDIEEQLSFLNTLKARPEKERKALFNNSVNLIDKLLYRIFEESSNRIDALENKKTMDSSIPVMFQYSSITQSAKEIKSEENKPMILLGCHVLHDGVGDAQHCIDFLANHERILGSSAYTPLTLMVCPIKNKEKIEDMFTSKGIKLPDKNIHIYYHEGNSMNEKDFNRYLETNSTLFRQFKRVKGMLNISTQHMDFNYFGLKYILPSGPILKKFLDAQNISFPIMSIAEHGAGARRIDDIIDPRTFILGVGLHNSVGFKFSPPLQKRSLNDVKSKEGKELVSILLGPNMNERAFSDSLLIPCYFQEKEGTKFFENVINSVLPSELSGPYKEAVFLVNKGQTYSDINDYRTLMSNKIASIEITKRTETGELVTEIIENQNAERGAKPVRIIEGFHLKGEDYTILRSNAQLFEGCSGDNSLENTLSENHIPLYQVRQWKIQFIDGLLNYCQESHPDKKLVHEFLNTLKPMSFNKGDKQEQINHFRDCLTPEFKAQWKLFVEDLRLHHNAYDNIQEHVKKLIEKPASPKSSRH